MNRKRVHTEKKKKINYRSSLSNIPSCLQTNKFDKDEILARTLNKFNQFQSFQILCITAARRNY